MIIDCHSRIWESPAQLGPSASGWLARNGGQGDLSADAAEYAATAREVNVTLVWGFRSQLLEADIPNSFLSDCAAQRPDRIKAIAAVDLAEPDCLERLENIAHRQEFVGVTISPAAQGFHPADTRAMALYDACQEFKLPLFIESGVEMSPRTIMEFAHPSLFDEAMRAFPALTLVIGSLGWPFTAEAIALLAKQPRAYADLSGLIRRPWDLYQVLVQAYQAGVTDKLLFGSDFPFATAATAIERIYRLNELTTGTNLPGVPREVLRGIVERDALAELGLAGIQNA